MLRDFPLSWKSHERNILIDCVDGFLSNLCPLFESILFLNSDSKGYSPSRWDILLESTRRGVMQKEVSDAD